MEIINEEVTYSNTPMEKEVITEENDMSAVVKCKELEEEEYCCCVGL